jgi:hypothetical protein
VLEDPALAVEYAANWKRRQAVSQRYAGTLPYAPTENG